MDKKDFTSGATSSGNVPPYECLTETFLKRCAERMQLGMHYGKHNWKKGASDKQFVLDRLNHAFEHLVKAQTAIDNGNLAVDDDLAAVAVNCMFAMEYDETCKVVQSEQAKYKEYHAAGLESIANMERDIADFKDPKYYGLGERPDPPNAMCCDDRGIKRAAGQEQTQPAAPAYDSHILQSISRYCIGLNREDRIAAAQYILSTI